MWSSALDVLLTTLRYLAPATLLSVFWGQQSFVFKLLKYIDCAFRSIVFSNEEQKQEVLKWLSETSPVEVDQLEAVWQNGWIVCAVLDAALPGTCAGHTPTKLSLKHAQNIADHYLGVEPVFSRQELESIDSLSKHQDWRLAAYLDCVRKALAKIDPPKPSTPKPIIENVQFTFDYVARGTGLSAAQVNNKMFFKIFPTAQQAIDPGEITIIIRGPNNTRGMTVLPPLLGKAQLIRQKLMGLQSKDSFTENALPITHGAMYMRSFGKNDMNKTYYIPKMKYDINIDVETKEDQVKVGYLVQYEGTYDISITSRGQNIFGSPFTITASKDIVNILEKESFCLEDGEEIDILDVKTDRKVVLRIVDFVTEKMLLTENGTLEKITEDEAQYLMSKESADDSEKENGNDEFKTSLPKSNRFKTVANRILTLNRVCKKINNSIKEKQLKALKVIDTLTVLKKTRNQQVPDIVNSTLNDINTNPLKVQDDREKLIIPENITVSLYTEKARLIDEIKLNDKPKLQEIDYLDLKNSKAVNVDSDDIYVDRDTPSNNPFLHDECEQSYETEKIFGSYVKSEYETHNSQNEDTECSPIKTLTDNYDKPSATNNPFVDFNIISLDRPKTPIYKIFKGDVTDRNDSLYVETNTEPAIQEQNTIKLNPFIDVHHNDGDRQLLIADFIIGAPVSLPPMINISSPDQCAESFIITTELNKDNYLQREESQLDSALKSEMERSSCHTSEFQSLDSNATENTGDVLPSDITCRSESSQSDRNMPSRKDLWDSAYVSIDDTSSSPDTNNNDNTTCETIYKNTYFNNEGSVELKRKELENMGPAEREIWQFESKNDSSRFEESRLNKFDVKRTLFTPIIEESDKSLLSSMKDLKVEDTKSEKDPVSVVITELDDIFREYLNSSETSSIADNKDNVEKYREIDYHTENACVDSASEYLADVKRHKTEHEGKISEVQQKGTESSSVSQILHRNTDSETSRHIYQYADTKQFGDSNTTNIVLEKKKYWDEKISQIEAARMEEIKAEKKRSLKAKHLRNGDSLTKKKGRQIVKNFLNAGGNQDTSQLIPVNRKNLDTAKISEPRVKLVEKWKKFWDDKLETEKEETESKIILPQSPETTAISLTKSFDKVVEGQENQSKTVIKQELCEEVFKAFETSPKRFFGTSRQQILNKIDSYLGKPNIAKELDESACDASTESGLVSSRVSLFHSMSKNKEMPLTQRRSKSMHNISQNKNHDMESGINSRISQIQIKQKDEAGPLKIKPNQREDFNQTGRNKLKTTLIVEEKRRVYKDTWYKNKSFDETVYRKQNQESSEKQELCRPLSYIEIHNDNIIRKTSLSKSEMDIFNKTTENQVDEDTEKYKSCEELPKISVKSFINMYENVSKTPTSKISKKKSNDTFGSQNIQSCSSSVSGLIGTVGMSNKLENKKEHKSMPHINISRERCQSASPKPVLGKYWTNKDLGVSYTETDSIDSIDLEILGVQDPTKQTTYLSLSDIELEIIENKSEVPVKSPAPITKNENLHDEYKSRFKMAKEYFKSLEELRDTKILSSKLNECELLLYNKATEESPDNKRPQKRLKKKIKSNSMPSSDISQVWNQLQNKGKDKSTDNRLLKISEKFPVEDLFSDIMDGRLSRQGSLRGIPNKKAVLETFRSMENVSYNKMSSYEISVSQLNEFAKDNQVKNAQTYLTEYPYLPTTDPSKYHSRIDTKASGLISMKELLNKRPRRNSVPDLRLNASFSADL